MNAAYSSAASSGGDDGPAKPGTSQEHGVTALAGRENSCFSDDRPGSLGLFHTGGGGSDGKGDFEIFSRPRRSRPWARETTGASVPASSSATPTPTRKPCSPSPPLA